MIDMNKAAFTAISVLTVLAALSGCATSKKARLTNEFLADLNVLKATCEKYSAGDRVYEQVDGVEGVFKAGVVDPYPDWSSQFGMKAPWVNFSTGDDIYTNVGEPKGGSYWYVESPPQNMAASRVAVFDEATCGHQIGLRPLIFLRLVTLLQYQMVECWLTKFAM